MSAEKKQKFLLKHAYPSYKKFYQPRALWFQEQRKAAQELRQNRRHINLLTIKMEQHSEYSIDEWISTFNNTEDLYEPNSDDIYIPNSDDEEKKVETDDVNYVDFKMLSQGTTSTQTPLMPSQEIEKTMMTTRLKKKTLNKRPRT